MYRVGNGIDFHRLEKNPERPFVLGGFVIPTEYALVGHSDADVLLHAISDSILGALALGDIGEYFPDTDPKWKNMDSKKIMEQTLKLMYERDYELVNVDSTVLAEKPKISPYRLNIRKTLSDILNIPLENISLKATTTEKMGFIGRQEGVGVFTTSLLLYK
ncbi:MAG: 2-C-methyl-D-erythritol 2,4-cyclodiphosphate synthase [Leptospiraceae bacterium]|nr:2-C-methyl-D-erythritol 2,4-cyclodiphosphate synthase [Leptospiraceae bacterium]